MHQGDHGQRIFGRSGPGRGGKTCLLGDQCFVRVLKQEADIPNGQRIEKFLVGPSNLRHTQPRPHIDDIRRDPTMISRASVSFSLAPPSCCSADLP